VSASLALSLEARLGSYDLRVEDVRAGRSEQAGEFRVEAYRKPEVEVRVEPVAPRVVPGGKARVRIRARYYFGPPVAGGRVRYQVRREVYEAAAPAPAPFDWLYGPGYGRYGYDYPWLRAGKDNPPAPADEEDWDSPYDYPAGEPLVHGEAQLDARGVAEVEVGGAGTALAADTPGWRLVFDVDVRDESRRTVHGRGNVLVCRQARAASLELDRGWYAPRDEAVAAVTLRTATGEGVAATGTLRLTRVTYGRPPERMPRLETVRTWDAKTDRRGRFTARIPLPAEGQYRLEFRAADASGQDVTAAATFWVHGPHFDGRAFRYAGLEIIPDRRSYRVGDTAHLLIHVTQPNARLLWSGDARSSWLAEYKFIDVPVHVLVLDVPIRAQHVPNLVVEGLVVADGRVLAETCELFVPPVERLLNVQLRTDRASYQPGTDGAVHVVVKDAAGKPVAGQVTLTAYDQAVTYIGEESNSGPAAALLTRLRIEPRPGHASSLDSWRANASGAFVCPEFEINDDGHPGITLGGSAPSGGDPSDAGSRTARAARRGPQDKKAGAGQGRETPVRSNFADTALWQPALVLGPDGTAEVRLRFPDSLTSWRLRAYALTATTQVGEATAHAVTAKDLMVRLQMPRFLVEGDEVVLSADVHNSLKADQDVRAALVTSAALGPLPGQKGGSAARRALVKAGAARGFDWSFRALKTGMATVTAEARAGGAADAMRRAVPVLAYGVRQEVARIGRFRAEEEGVRTLSLTVPGRADPSATRLELTFAPGPVGPMLDALPFLMGYPYGCTEQTMSRFYPSILAAESLKKLGTDLEALARLRGTAGGDRGPFGLAPAPVVDSAELRRMADAGLERLYRFQHPDGGWGWWPDDASVPYLTAYVLMGLQTARRAGFPVRPAALEGGYHYLLAQVGREKHRPATGPREEDRQTDAFVAYVLSLGLPTADRPPADSGDDPKAVQALLRQQLDTLFDRRATLNAYGRALLALALHNGKDSGRAGQVLRELLALAEQDDKEDTAHVPTAPEEWWRWWNSDIETNAWVLRAVLAIDPPHATAPRLARWLVGHRQNANFWRSTRDTALAVAALADYVAAQKARAADCRVTVRVDGKVVGRLRLTAKDFLRRDSRLTLAGDAFAPGRHQVSVTKAGRGELFFACRLLYFRTDGPLRAAGKGLAIRRQYYRVGEDGKVAGPPLAGAARLAVGDVVEVALRVTAEGDYDYLAFEDPRPAGCEPVQVQSGAGWFGPSWATVEVRDDRLVLFVPSVRRGDQVFRYRLRAETPGRFRALPAAGFAMYAPEIRATSDEAAVHIGD
jgi:uncharacterized protein YfaS (alpha-2-macroglobulin family)